MEERLQQLIDGYQLSSRTIELVRSTPIVLLVGISGAGKDTIKHRLLDTSGYHHIVSHTTRQPRENSGVLERDGVDYHFISMEQAAHMLEAGEFVEAKKYGTNIYGTSAAEIAQAKDTGQIALTDLEVQGVAEYKAISANVIAQFILPPNFEEWQRRLHARYGENGADPGDIERRMHTAITELEEALSKPYYHFVINAELDLAVTTVDKIARNHDTFTEVDDTVRQQAAQLLEDLRRHVEGS